MLLSEMEDYPNCPQSKPWHSFINYYYESICGAGAKHLIKRLLISVLSILISRKLPAMKTNRGPQSVLP